MLKLISAFYFTKQIKQQAMALPKPTSVGYGSEIKVRKEIPQIQVEPTQITEPPIINNTVTKTKPKPLSFVQRLELADEKTQGYYRSLTDYFEMLNIKSTTYKHKMKFYIKDKTVANLYFTHKTLRLCIALQPNSFSNEMLRYRDFSTYKKHKITPMAVLLNSNKSVRNCKMLVYKAINVN